MVFHITQQRRHNRWIYEVVINFLVRKHEYITSDISKDIFILKIWSVNSSLLKRSHFGNNFSFSASFIRIKNKWIENSEWNKEILAISVLLTLLPGVRWESRSEWSGLACTLGGRQGAIVQIIVHNLCRPLTSSENIEFRIEIF